MLSPTLNPRYYCNMRKRNLWGIIVHHAFCIPIYMHSTHDEVISEAITLIVQLMDMLHGSHCKYPIKCMISLISFLCYKYGISNKEISLYNKTTLSGTGMIVANILVAVYGKSGRTGLFYLVIISHHWIFSLLLTKGACLVFGLSTLIT